MRRDQRQSRPVVERVEVRILLSTLAGGPRRPLNRGLASVQANAPGLSDSEFSNPLYNPVGTPTHHQVALQRFQAGFQGTYSQGRGRFSGESQQLFIESSGTVKSVFLHGTAHLRVITPTDPTQPIGGQILLRDRNSSVPNEIGFNLIADRNADVDRAGRPVRLTITDLDENSTSGAYAGGSAEGVVVVRYTPGGVSLRRGAAKGKASIMIDAQVYAPGRTPF